MRVRIRVDENLYAYKFVCYISLFLHRIVIFDRLLNSKHRGKLETATWKTKSKTLFKNLKLETHYV